VADEPTQVASAAVLAASDTASLTRSRLLRHGCASTASGAEASGA
jgi:hypothetical protein